MSFASNAVIAKARAVSGKSLTADDYTQLAAKESVADVCAYLKQTERYGKALSSVNVQTVHRGQLEAVVRKAVFDIFERFYRFDHTESRVFFEYIVMQLEIEQLISALQCIASGASMDFIASVPMFLTERSEIDFPALGISASYAEAAELLRGTSYEKPLVGALAEAEASGRLDVCSVERGLYTNYYMNMLKNAENDYKGTARKELKRLILGVIDMKNVAVAYRCGKFFGTSAREAKDFMLPFKRRLTDEAIERMVEQKDISKIAAELEKLGYGLHSRDIPRTVELLTDRITADHLKKTLRLSKNSSVVYFAFTELMNNEYKNIQTIVEGVRYGLDSGAILDMLIM